MYKDASKLFKSFLRESSPIFSLAYLMHHMYDITWTENGAVIDSFIKEILALKAYQTRVGHALNTLWASISLNRKINQNFVFSPNNFILEGIR